MVFPSRFFTQALRTRTLASALGLLSFAGAPTGTSAQAPVVPPAAPAPKLQTAAANIPVFAPASGESTQGTMQILDLLASLSKSDQDGKVGTQRMGFEIPERAINEYLAYSLRNKPRPGITAMTVALLPRNEISVMAEIDFSTLTQWNAEILPEPLRAALSGKRVVQMNAHFESAHGTFTFSLKDVHGPDGKLLENKIMAGLLQAIGAHQPESYDASRPISLPFGLKRVWTEKQSVLGET